MVRSIQLALVIGAALAGGGTEHLSAQTCNAGTIKGDWGYYITGTRPSPPNGPIEAVIGTSIRRFDGVGGFTQVGNLHGALSGHVPDLPSKGTYTVNADCTGVAKLDVPGVAFQPEERFVIVDDGNGIFSMSSTPATLMIQNQARRLNSVKSEEAVNADKAIISALDNMKKLLNSIAFRLGLVQPNAGS